MKIRPLRILIFAIRIIALMALLPLMAALFLAIFFGMVSLCRIAG
jgi:hypothetical protein